MKTIEITDEMYDSLMKLSKEMTTQDMRCTRMPHMFQIKTTEQVAAYDGCDGEDIWIDEDGNELNNDESIRDFIKEDLYDKEFDTDKYVIDKRVEEMDEDDTDNYLNNHRGNYRRIRVTTENKYQNTFLTAKACKEHIKANGYHYNNPICYLNHAFRNPEMELVSRFLCELTGGKLHT